MMIIKSLKELQVVEKNDKDKMTNGNRDISEVKTEKGKTRMENVGVYNKRIYVLIYLERL